MTPEKLSIVVPVYNVQEFLEECLESLVNQTYENIEIIIVNDVTPDNSEEIVLKYQKVDSRIKYVKHQNNLGLGGARNTGIANAVGKWITFVDSDDYISLNCYESMMNLLAASPESNLAIFSAINFDDDTNEQSYDSYFDVPNVSRSNWFWDANVTACNKIFRLEDILKMGEGFPEKLKHEDEEFWFKYCASTPLLPVTSKERFYHYRQRPGSIMTDRSSRLDMPIIFSNITDYLKEKNLLEENKLYLLDRINVFLIHNFDLFEGSNVSKLEGIKYTLDSACLVVSELTNCHYYTKVLFSIKDTSHIELIAQLINKYSKDKWYKFGQLPLKEKLLNIFRLI